IIFCTFAKFFGNLRRLDANSNRTHKSKKTDFVLLRNLKLKISMIFILLKSMRRNILLLSLLVISAGHFSGNGLVPQNREREFDLADIQARGYINVLMPLNTPSYYLYKGRPVGYEYEMATLLAKQLRVQLRVKSVSNAQEAIDKLNCGEGDIVALPMDITPARQEQVSFTNPFFYQRQVLVRRKSALPRLEINSRNKATNAKIERIQKAAPQIELPIPMVAGGAIPYTVSNEHVANLLEEIDAWKKDMKKNGDGNYLYKKHFDMPVVSSSQLVSHYSSLGGKRISPYDELLKKIGEQYNFDWRFLASIAGRESRFNAGAASRAGALGLMQIRPDSTGTEEETMLLNPENNIQAGAKKLQQLRRYWSKSIADSTERVKFVLASYNVGLTHVQDAVILAKKNNHEINWDNAVSKFLLKKNESKYYTDPDVKAGKCNCKSVVNYVNDIIHSFEQYEKCI